MFEEGCSTMAKRTELTLTERLRHQATALESQLDDIKRAQQLLDENPKLRELFDVVVRVRHIL